MLERCRCPRSGALGKPIEACNWWLSEPSRELGQHENGSIAGELGGSAPDPGLAAPVAIPQRT